MLHHGNNAGKFSKVSSEFIILYSYSWNLYVNYSSLQLAKLLAWAPSRAFEPFTMNQSNFQWNVHHENILNSSETVFLINTSPGIFQNSKCTSKHTRTSLKRRVHVEQLWFCVAMLQNWVSEQEETLWRTPMLTGKMLNCAWGNSLNTLNSINSWNFCLHLLTLLTLQICMMFVFLWETKDDD